VRYIVVVDDASADGTGDVVETLNDDRVTLLRRETKGGVGAAMRSGYRHAMSTACDIIVKLDADGQMDPEEISRLVWPIQLDLAEYAKGNRFRVIGQPSGMPPLRWVGNVGLSFLNKVANGYWHVFDPQCGFTAIHSSRLALLDLDRIATDYFFENDMLVNLNVMDARVVDVAISTRYGSETSTLSVWRTLVSFPLRLAHRFVWRVVKRHLVWDFGAIGALVILGLILSLFGLIFGSYEWARSIELNTRASTGTVMLAVLPLIIGIQFLLQALMMEIQSSPGAAETRAYARAVSHDRLDTWRGADCHEGVRVGPE